MNWYTDRRMYQSNYIPAFASQHNHGMSSLFMWDEWANHNSSPHHVSSERLVIKGSAMRQRIAHRSARAVAVWRILSVSVQCGHAHAHKETHCCFCMREQPAIETTTVGFVYTCVYNYYYSLCVSQWLLYECDWNTVIGAPGGGRLWGSLPMWVAVGLVAHVRVPYDFSYRGPSLYFCCTVLIIAFVGLLFRITQPCSPTSC